MTRRIAVPLALVAASTLLCLGQAGAAAPTRRPVVAPYVNVSVPMRNLGRAISSAHLHEFTAAFVVGRGCTPTWDNGVSLTRAKHVSRTLARARADGARMIVSFGGASGTELAAACTNPDRLRQAYDHVIRELHAHSLDFDVEGAATADSTSIARRFVAIHALEAEHPKLSVSLTVPVQPTGLDRTGVRLLRAARAHHVRVAVVNIMTMDYRGRHEMGRAAIHAAERTLTQMRRVWPDATYARLGITPMIGRNDTRSEVFSLDDARRVVAFSSAHHVGRLAFWSIARDERCAHPSANARSDCSGVDESALAYTSAFTSLGTR
jgi:hypothetical protein